MNRRHPLRFLLRRACALFALVGLLAVSVEGLLPDVHDGDVATLQVTDASAGHSSPADGHDGIPPTPTSHPVPHADHCGHGHGLAVGGAAEPDCRLTAAHDVVDTTGDGLVSVSIQPHQRPPIA